MNKIVFIVALALLLAPGVSRADNPFTTLLDTEAIGAAAFKKAHPHWDGSGVVIAVLDTGVDMGIPGLRETPDGEVKIIEARDFTGEAVVECSRASFETGDDGRDVWRTRDGWLGGIGLPDNDGRESPVFIGFLEESSFRNAAVSDINGNSKTDDRFGVAVRKGGDGKWAAVVDLGADGSLEGDPTLGSYHIGHDSFTFGGHDPVRRVAPVTVAIEIEEEGGEPKRVVFHIPTGSHGTHVAGIAAGYRLNGRDGFDGVAPGARLMSLKIGDNRLSGGSTVTESMKKALEFAARWGREHDTAVVVNMSYGVGSELEGMADIEKFVDGFARDNPHVVPVFSAGNSGPGISTVGSPAAALNSIAVAAAYTPGNSRDLLGASDKGITLFHFSARGGEIAKPDVAAPGIASSSVPYWEKHDLFRGTSMAAPQVAGAAALILSSVRDMALPWNSGILKRALIQTARPVAGYDRLDVGGGLVDVGRARKAFVGMAKVRGAADVMDFEVTTEVPTNPGGKGRAVYWRADGWHPDRDHPATVKVKAQFATGANGRSKADYYRTFGLSASERWVKLSKGKVYLKSDHEASFDLWIDDKGVSKPGIHVATVTGSSGEQQSFTFPVTVVTPFRPKDRQGVPTIDLESVKLPPSQVRRIPFQVPAGTATARVSVDTSKNGKASMYVFLFDEQGRRVPVRQPMVASDRGSSVSFGLTRSDYLEPGTYELVLYAVPTARHTSIADVKVRFFSLDSGEIRRLASDAGRRPSATVPVTNLMRSPFIGKAAGLILGYEKIFDKRISGDSMTEGFHVSSEVERVDFEITMSPADYARFTDVAVNVLDKNGKALVQTGFTSRVARLSFTNPSPGKRDDDYRLEIKGGRAIAGGPEFRVKVAVRHVLFEKARLTGTVGGDKRFTLYPSVTSRVKVEADRTPRSVPSGARWFGHVDFVNEKDGLAWLRVPVRARP